LLGMIPVAISAINLMKL
uniref:Skin secreted peptide P5-1 n=1 Tax=Phasmahyla jandaia TaxID=762504 RepID=SSP51_PHAJA|nr:RecName: Full=Skin secreted peptide P5-1; Short=PjP5-1 [Phasmahyla jandaia]